MWKSKNSLTAPTIFFPQAVCADSKSFTQPLWSKFGRQLVHRATCSLSTGAVDKNKRIKRPFGDRRYQILDIRYASIKPIEYLLSHIVYLQLIGSC